MFVVLNGWRWAVVSGSANISVIAAKMPFIISYIDHNCVFTFA